MTRCPCRSGKNLSVCCQPLHRGKPAPTAEALMRARYSAYVLGDVAFLHKSWSRATRPPKKLLAAETGQTWLGLDILQTLQGGAGDETGVVEFVAHYQTETGKASLREVSRFRRENGRWVYVDGEHRQEGEA